MASFRNLDLNLLKVFDAIYASGSVSGAARRLGVSQPSVSRGLGRLREHFDDPLFERSGNGVTPTAKAEGILDSVKTALKLIEETTDDDLTFDPETAKRHFKMIMPDFVEAMAIPQIINALPVGSSITFEALAFGGDVRAAIIEGDVDIAVLPFLSEETDITYHHLLNDHFIIAARKDHPDLVDGFQWPLLKRLRFVTLPDWMFKLGRLDEMLRTQGLQRNVTYVAHKLAALPLLVSSTDLVAFIGSQYATAMQDQWGIDIFDAPGLSTVKQDIYLGYSKASDNDPGIQWLCSQILKTYRQGEAATDALEEVRT